MTAETQATTHPEGLARERKEALWAYIGVVAAIACTAHLLPAGIQEYAYSVVLAAMVYFPVLRSEKYGQPLAAYGITLKNWPREIGFALIVAGIIFPLFLLGNHLWQTVVFDRTLAPAWPARNVAYLAFEQILLIALPEEFFYRGWLQTVLTRRWPARFRILGGDFGKAVWLTSLLFAIGHLASIPHPFRLATFFPSLLFGWMAVKRGSLVSPIILHGLSNVLMAFIGAGYR